MQWRWHTLCDADLWSFFFLFFFFAKLQATFRFFFVLTKHVQFKSTALLAAGSGFGVNASWCVPTYLCWVTPDRDAKGSRQPEVSQLQLPVLRTETHMTESVNHICSHHQRHAHGIVDRTIPTYNKDSGAASVANTYSVYEKILRLEISVQDVSTVTESQAFQQLVHEWLQ